MKKSLFILFIITIFLCNTYAKSNQNYNKLDILLLPVNNLSDNKNNNSFSNYIFNILKRNLETINGLNLVYLKNKLIIDENNFDKKLAAIKQNIDCNIFISSGYFINKNNLHIVINIFDTESLELLNSFSKTMPADLDMLINMEDIAISIAQTIKKDLLKPENSKALTISRKRELQFAVLSGISTGRTVCSWSQDRPFISYPVSLEYTHYLNNTIHLRFGLEYLPFDYNNDVNQCEISFETLMGYNTSNRNPFSFDFGIAAIYDFNSKSDIIAYNNGDDLIYQKIHRISFSLPIQISKYYYLNDKYFINIRYKYNGLTYTIEALNKNHYTEATDKWNYDNGLSIWNLTAMALTIQGGINF